MTPARVRPATPDDAAAVSEVATAAWHDAHAPLVGAAAVREFLGEHYGVPDLRDAIRRPGSEFLVAVTDDPGGESVVGFVEVGPTDDPGVWCVYRLYVHPDHYGRGHGTRLLDAAERRLRERPDPVERVRLTVMADNDRAVAFYESRGFTRQYAAENDWGGTDYVYAKPLDDTA